MTKEIKLTQGQVVLVDDEDYEWLNQWKWYADRPRGSYYATRGGRTKYGKRYLIYMHRELLGLKYKDGYIGDHINRDTLNNCRSNLRVVDCVINTRNHVIVSTNTSGYNGVLCHKGNRRWQACITVDCKHIHLGYYSNIEDAVVSRKQGEIEHWGNCYASQGKPAAITNKA